VQLDDGETGDGLSGFEQSSDIHDAETVAVVLDHGEDRPPADAPVDLGHVVPQVLRVDFDPRVV
jgi:hypothetical protein